MLNCASPSEHGVAQYCVPAVLYVAQDEWITHGNLLDQPSFCFVYEMVITMLKSYFQQLHGEGLQEFPIHVCIVFRQSKNNSSILISHGSIQAPCSDR